ncbi:MAG: hypothetical protein ACJ749_04745, partial [Flavisolibacter sp.]
MRSKAALLFVILFFYTGLCLAQKIDRKALVQRHKVIVTKADPLSSLTVGNGAFAFTTDVTGLQTFPKEYEKGVSLGTESEWGWHSFIDTVGYKREETLKNYHVNNRDISYTVQWDTPQRNRAAANWFRQNPHRLQLGNIGFEFIKENGKIASLDDIKDIHQELDPWTGEIKSHFTIDKIPVDVSTYAHASKDAIAVKVRSPLIREARLKIYLRFPYPTGQWTDEGTNYQDDEKHVSEFSQAKRQGGIIRCQLDTTKYYVHLWWAARAEIQQKQPHYFLISPAKQLDSFELTVQFTTKENLGSTNSYHETKATSELEWYKYWNTGGAIDFAGSTDPRAFELERRIVLSQYLMKAQEAGSFPPQETGLTYNSWFGKPHLEMHWWHAAHYALFGRIELLERSLDWYRKVFPIAKAIAKRQGFEGARWQKMTDNSGEETPSTVGALLIWQQPHFIYFAELVYRDHKSSDVLNKYKDLVFATADFMASFPYYDAKNKRYILGKGLIPAQERFKAEQTFNPAFELVYWKWALTTAQQWRVRLKMPPNNKWDEVIKKLS